MSIDAFKYVPKGDDNRYSLWMSDFGFVYSYKQNTFIKIIMKQRPHSLCEF